MSSLINIIKIASDDRPFVLFFSDPDNKSKSSPVKRKNTKQYPTSSKFRKITDFTKK